MNRHLAREYAFLLVFEASFSKEPNLEEIIAQSQEVNDLLADEYTLRLLNGVTANIDLINSKLEPLLVDWKNNRISRVVRCLMQIAVYEIEFEGLDASVAINEAVNLCKAYDFPESASFLNGVLGNYARARSSAEESK